MNEEKSKRIKPIETVYSGYRFRSRLEARWAVFFDYLKIKWEYEKEGFDFGDKKYLPDLWLSTVNMWAEIKPGKFTEKEKELAILLANQTGYPVLMLDGVPENKSYKGIAKDGDEYDFCLTNYHNYPQNEHRFFACPGDYEKQWSDTRAAANAAKSARFEFGEHGARK